MSIDRVAAFYAFVNEREAIRLRRAAGQPWPWTADLILQTYSFTNVHREHDRTSRALITNFYQPHADAPLPEVLFNAAVFRYFGTSEFAQAVGWQRPTVQAIAHIKSVATGRQSRGERVFTGAYIVTNCGRKGPKIIVVCSFLDELIQNLYRVSAQIERDWSMENAISALNSVSGFATFMSKETLLDTRYTNAWPPNTPIDAETWTAMGPGARRGASIIRDDANIKLSETAALAVCREIYARRHDYWPSNYVSLTLDAIQFQLCEFAKYVKVQRGWGRPRKRYNP